MCVCVRVEKGGSVVVVHGLSCSLAYVILVAQSGAEPATPGALEAQSLNHWTAKEVL